MTQIRSTRLDVGKSALEKTVTIYDPGTRVLLVNRGLEDSSDVTIDNMNHNPKRKEASSFAVMLGPGEAPEC
ncbi:hypothetical protein [Rhodopirellula sallentina]|uniref:Uncharacterized protein n=1 Tax=Rhodopirellula sallentina SM41 TaxID=1263870 RepID=M5UJ76_9BACT|nr:hypothetical protein [Rhodopirellula sallentina]EMI57896.1 hypothetical protein RSSM_00669 [Rhodopirellula sallentina SM41]